MDAEQQQDGLLMQCGLLLLVELGVWLLLAVPAYLASGTTGLWGLAIAAGLCLVPGWLVFWMASRYRVAQSVSVAILSGSVLRMLFVLFGVLAVGELFPAMGDWQFLLWVVPFYLVTLLVETLLLVRRIPS